MKKSNDKTIQEEIIDEFKDEALVAQRTINMANNGKDDHCPICGHCPNKVVAWLERRLNKIDCKLIRKI